MVAFLSSDSYKSAHFLGNWSGRVILDILYIIQFSFRTKESMHAYFSRSTDH
jgi:hypothetical protein